MKAKAIAAAVLAVCLLTVGAVAAPVGTAPDDTPASEAPGQSGPPGHADDHAGGNESAEEAERGSAGDARRGPPAEMPDSVPEFVTTLHETIRSHIQGTLNVSLGEALQGVLAPEDLENASSDDGSARDDASGTAGTATDDSASETTPPADA